MVMSAMSRARRQARSLPAKAKGSRFAAGRKSFACEKPRSRTGRALAPSTGEVDRTIAAAPSETGEQSVRRSGPETSGLRAETVRQNSSPRSMRRWAYGLFAPLRWFFAAIVPMASSQSLNRSE